VEGGDSTGERCPHVGRLDHSRCMCVCCDLRLACFATSFHRRSRPMWLLHLLFLDDQPMTPLGAEVFAFLSSKPDFIMNA